jgi:hypothetical protein
MAINSEKFRRNFFCHLSGRRREYVPFNVGNTPQLHVATKTRNYMKNENGRILLCEAFQAGTE